MIKLNNKNITYVAFADSSNSLKAPKEIWYADSNNSVKLVYRRKDALIEGEDYEKYHWLEGRNGAYINTNHKLVTIDDAFEFHAHYDKTLRNELNQEQEVFGFSTGRNTNINNLFVRVYIYSSNGFNGNYFWHEAGSSSWGGVDYGVNTDGDAVIKLSADENHYYVSYDDVNVVKTPSLPLTKETYGDIYLFNSNDDILTGHFNGGISYFRITDPTFTTDKLHFIPCKLLKPVPKWLDANGIRRQVGECGMIDLVSGKFYGNVNSVGTFTVENYYERKEWLQGDGTAYIEGISYNLWDNNLSLQVGKASDSGNSRKYIVADHLKIGEDRNASPSYFMVIFRQDNDSTPHIADIAPYNSMPDVVTMDFYIENSLFYCNQNGIVKTNYPAQTAIESSWKSVSPQIYSAKMSYIREVLPDGSYRSNLIPCTLTMDLPAYMDANNIARTKGTSGMWDLVSDRFYGNVANSGTFKAVNLAEGVDYEVHQWLKAEIPIAVTMITLSIESQNFNWKVKIEQLGNTSYFRSDDYQYFTATNTTKIVHIWDIPNAETIFSAQTTKTDGMIVDISSTSDLLTFNGEIIPKYGFQNVVCMIRNANNGVRDAITYTSSITVDGIERYIPVKLIRPIPAKYDANGIARQAGECGMYDTVNDVFYGNVASSGSFTVSDDN